MDALIQSLREKVNSDMPFDLEVLIDDIVNLQKQIDAQHKQELHTQGRNFQQFYDSIIHQLIEMITGEILRIKSEPSCIQTQRYYKTFKTILNMLIEIPISF